MTQMIHEKKWFWPIVVIIIILGSAIYLVVNKDPTCKVYIGEDGNIATQLQCKEGFYCKVDAQGKTGVIKGVCEKTYQDAQVFYT